ncbi:site-specific DNA-methyltransferase [Sphingomonas montanisoli]|uniref:site-specific DNA-methyltransferase (adenine-specific) n=1 Tax=Sphingomonas montanisoli TaxID=2606412 RepID=A0A5D9C230_9SPHN|nr:DNA methyltransferase [Sphingomonas montanisoli]TZG25804.1 DNA methylase N-4 [Sphingomonas montanisoli]
MTNADGGALPAAYPAFDPLKIELRPTASLKAAKRNARTHSARQLAQVQASISKFGFLAPIIVSADGHIVAGHARWTAAKALKLEEVPVIPVEHLTADELRAYALADNKIAANSGWDEDILRIEIAELAVLSPELEPEILGFTTTEIDLLLDPVRKPDKTETLPVLDRRVTLGVERGDLWLLGDHRLLCGDSREPASFARLMGDERARMVFSDPPYNVRIEGHVGGLGAIHHAEFAMASGEMSRTEFTTFLTQVFRNAADVSMDGAIHYQCMDWRHMSEMLEAGQAVYSDLKNLCVWSKDNGGMGSFYRSQHELVFVWKVGTAPHLNTVELGRNGRYRTNIWEYPAASKTGQSSDLSMHPTVKPVPMVVDAIKDTSKRGEIVLDAFGGSGSTLIAAEKAKRRAQLIEYEPKYCETTIRRWQKLAGREAVLDATGETFAEAHARRGAAMEDLADRALGLTGEVA